jgi:phosphoglycerate dehydrogenase-like enzyme
MDAMPQLRGIVSPILGYEWVDVAEATRRGIPVVNGEVPENRESMAEATIMLLLALLYRLHETEAQMRSSFPGPQPQRRMLKGRTVGIIGSGGIARQIIRRLQPWDVVLQVHTRVPSPDLPGVRLVDLDDLLSTSDVVIVMTSLDTSSRHLLDAKRLRRMKRGALLINTARGGLIDQSSLVKALESGHIAAAALDVFEVEPLPATDPLRELPNVILTPHAVGHTLEMHAALPRAAVENVLQLLRGELPASCRNREVADVRREHASS